MFAVALSLAAMSAPPCSSSHLHLRLGRGGAAAGTAYVPLVFVNEGSSACSLYGYPGVSSVAGSNARQVGAPAARSPGAKHTVVLAPGRVASALYGQADALNYPKSRCRAVHARGLRVYPPNQHAALFVPWPHLACSNTSAHDSHVDPVEAGAGG